MKGKLNTVWNLFGLVAGFILLMTSTKEINAATTTLEFVKGIFWFVLGSCSFGLAIDSLRGES